ncbi:hypothetical protein Nepgr_024740 [Nepenthes gracilis]|uniref:Uncharacterized protein n=1 Tax=Nepenthes gracilis TaxID=150966 RepID=A0AAD3T533_NEPGR|nr:hypothetical protein Nepgr_024740 [Nepenthes gracilis]
MNQRGQNQENSRLLVCSLALRAALLLPMLRGDLLMMPCQVGLLAAPNLASVPTGAVFLGCVLFARHWGLDDAGHFLLQAVESVFAWRSAPHVEICEVSEIYVCDARSVVGVLLLVFAFPLLRVAPPGGVEEGWSCIEVLVFVLPVGENGSSTGLIAHFGVVDICDDELPLFVAFAGIVLGNYPSIDREVGSPFDLGSHRVEDRDLSVSLLLLECVFSFGWQGCEDVADFDGVGKWA